MKAGQADSARDDRRMFERRRRKAAEQDVQLFLQEYFFKHRRDRKAIAAFVALLMQYYSHGSVDALWHWLDVGGEAKRQELTNGRRKDFENG
jgi:hypothetical protein